MYAIVEIAGQQFKVKKDQQVFVHRLSAEEGDKVNFDNVLLIDDNGSVNVGAPAIQGAQVTAKVLKHLKGDKVIVFKKKRRKGYKKKNGHRQYLTEIKIEGITASGAKKAAPKAKAKAEPKAKTTEAPKAKEVKAAAPKAKEVKAEATDISSMTVAELKAIAKERGIEGISAMKKADLVAALSK